MNDFMLAMVLDFPDSWPDSTNKFFGSGWIDPYEYRLFLIVDGSFMIGLFEKDKFDPIGLVQSPVINFYGEGIARLIIMVFSKSGKIEMSINGIKITDGDKILNISKSNDVLNGRPPEISIDHVGKEAAQRKRGDRRANFLKQDNAQMKVDRRWVDLRETCQLLRDAVELMMSGEVRYIRSVSVHLRVLVGPGKGNHILQDCAGFECWPLNVWVRPPSDPTLWTPKNLDKLWFHLERSVISYRPNGLNSHETDLDAWFEQEAYTINGISLSQGRLFNSVVDKIGAHAEFDNREVIEFLQSFINGDFSLLQRYLMETSEVVLLLAEEVLQKKSSLKIGRAHV